MDPLLKIFLDAGKWTQGSESATAYQSLRQALSIADGKMEVLVSSFKYLVMNEAHSEAVTTFLEAILEANGQEVLIASITSLEVFLKYLAYERFCEIIESHLINDPSVIKWLQSALAIEVSLDFETIQVLCRFGKTTGADFLRPGRLWEVSIDKMLEWLKLPPEEFFHNLVDTVLDQCINSRPQDKSQSWLGSFLHQIIDYYGDAAWSWISEQVEKRKSQPFFWKTALEHLLSKSTQQSKALRLTSEQHAWMRQLRLERMRQELNSQLHHLMHDYRGESGQVVIQAPLLLREFSSDFPGHEFRPVWSWLLCEAAEAAIYSWFHDACQDLVEDFASPEDSITGALCAYLKSHAARYRDIIDIAWKISHPNQQMKLAVDYVDCRRGRDVGGADLVLVLSVTAPGAYIRSSFTAFQCKKVQGPSLRLSDREIAQKEQLRSFTHSSYYMLYPCEYMTYEARGPIVLSARTLGGLLRAQNTSTVNRDTLLSIGRRLEEYFVADLLPGWSGDERWETPELIREVVEAALRPVHILHATFSAIRTGQEG